MIHTHTHTHTATHPPPHTHIYIYIYIYIHKLTYDSYLLVVTDKHRIVDTIFYGYFLVICTMSPGISCTLCQHTTYERTIKHTRTHAHTHTETQTHTELLKPPLPAHISNQTTQNEVKLIYVPIGYLQQMFVDLVSEQIYNAWMKGLIIGY